MSKPDVHCSKCGKRATRWAYALNCVPDPDTKEGYMLVCGKCGGRMLNILDGKAQLDLERKAARFDALLAAARATAGDLHALGHYYGYAVNWNDRVLVQELLKAITEAEKL